MQVYFETDFVTIGYNRVVQAVIMAWKTPPLSSEFRETLNTLLTATIHFKTGKVIADSRNFGVMAIEDQEWSAAWGPVASEKGCSHMAIIMPEDVYAKMAINDAADYAKQLLTTAYFDSMEKAVQWIAKC
ncbi:hypothetical protein [Ohtaekwangia sp.]|uniref:hypothetical protein n=1 Tax=Ohtaekwangia sp. TaxID=2066019 RepID=UPI002F922424